MRPQRAPARARSRVSTSICTLTLPSASCSAACSTGAMPPAAAMWFSLIRMPSYSPTRWFCPPPTRTAYFSAMRRPGRVLRVSRMAARVPAHGLDIGPGGGGHGRQGLQEIQRRALGGQQGAGIATDFDQHAAGCRQQSPSSTCQSMVQAEVEHPKTGVEPRPAGDHRGFAADDAGARGLRGGNQPGGEVAAADILVQRARDIGLDQLGIQYRHIQFRHEGLKSPRQASFRCH